MHILIDIGGWIFWGVLAFFVGVPYAAGLARAISLHLFLVRLRHAADGKWMPFNRFRHWAVEFASDFSRLSDWPWNTPKVTMTFDGYQKPVSGYWNGIRDWSIKRNAPTTSEKQ